MPHGHSHGGAELHIPRSLRRALALALVPVVVATAIGVLVLWPSGRGPNLKAVFGQTGDLVRASVVGAEREPCLGSPAGSGDLCQHFRAEITEGRARGTVVSLEAGGGSESSLVSVGDKILLGRAPGDGGTQYYFADFQRDVPIAWLFVLFVVAAVVFGRWSGVRALAALAASLLTLVWFVIPSVLRGHSPIAVAIVGSALVMLVVLYVTGGFTAQTTVTVLGTMLSLALIGTLAWVFVRASHFTGLADEDAVFLQAASGRINLQGLLLGGIVIGSLGVLDDMTVTQVSAVWELRRASDRYGFASLYRAAERIGRDHIASTINTLVLAYAGASLPLMIIFTQSDLELRHVLTSEVIGVELVRTLVGSIGLIASVPITTALAAFVVTRPHVEPEDGHDVDEMSPSLLDRVRARLEARQRTWRPSRHEREIWGDELDGA